MRRGPKGAAIETQREETVKKTWNFDKEFILDRLGLPPDAQLYVAFSEGEVDANGDGQGRMKVTITDSSAHLRLTAVATEVRKPGQKIAGNA